MKVWSCVLLIKVLDPLAGCERLQGTRFFSTWALSSRILCNSRIKHIKPKSELWQVLPLAE